MSENKLSSPSFGSNEHGDYISVLAYSSRGQDSNSAENDGSLIEHCRKLKSIRSRNLLFHQGSAATARSFDCHFLIYFVFGQWRVPLPLTS